MCLSQCVPLSMMGPLHCLCRMILVYLSFFFFHHFYLFHQQRSHKVTWHLRKWKHLLKAAQEKMLAFTILHTTVIFGCSFQICVVNELSSRVWKISPSRNTTAVLPTISCQAVRQVVKKASNHFVVLLTRANAPRYTNSDMHKYIFSRRKQKKLEN